jgi:hypothetical protein
MTRHPSRAVVYVPVSGPDARPYLLTCAQACERGGYDVVAFTAEPSEVQRMLDRREVDVIVVADVEHRLDLHDAGITPRIELAAEVPAQVRRRWLPRPRWLRR